MKKIFPFLLLLFLMTSPVFANLVFSNANISFGIIRRPSLKVVTFTVKNSSDTPFLGRISTDAPWLKISSKDIALNPGEESSIEFAVDSKDMSPGDHNGKVIFSSMLGATTKSVPVFVTVIQGKNDPVLSVENERFEFGNVVRGENPLGKIWVENLGSGVLEIDCKYPSWLLCEDKISLRGGQKRPVMIRAMTRELVPDKYNDEIVFKSNAGDKNYPVSINVVLRPEDPILSVKPAELDFGMVKKGKRARAKMILQNKGKSSADLTISYPEYVVDGIEEVKSLEKDRSILVVLDTKGLVKGVTRDKIRVVSKYKIFDVPFRVVVK